MAASNDERVPALVVQGNQQNGRLIGGEALRRLVTVHGTECAAWLVRKHRGQLRRQRFVCFKIGTWQNLPVWFRVAITKLKERKAWDVEMSLDGMVETYRLNRVAHGATCRGGVLAHGTDARVGRLVGPTVGASRGGALDEARDEPRGVARASAH